MDTPRSQFPSSTATSGDRYESSWFRRFGSVVGSRRQTRRRGPLFFQVALVMVGTRDALSRVQRRMFIMTVGTIVAVMSTTWRGLFGALLLVATVSVVVGSRASGARSVAEGETATLARELNFTESDVARLEEEARTGKAEIAILTSELAALRSEVGEVRDQLSDSSEESRELRDCATAQLDVLQSFFGGQQLPADQFETVVEECVYLCEDLGLLVFFGG